MEVISGGDLDRNESFVSKDLLENKTLVNLLSVPNRGFVMLTFDKKKINVLKPLGEHQFITHYDQVQNTAELRILLQTIICP